MIERIIKDALEAGVEEFTADPRKLETFFLKNRGVPQVVVDDIKIAFAAKPPKVFHQFPRHDQFPPGEPAAAWAIVLSTENETETPLGNVSGIIGQGEDGGLDGSNPDAGADCMNSIWEQVFSVITLTDHPDFTVYYYHICKLFLTRARPFFHDRGVLSVGFRGGDVAPDPQYIPAHLFARQLTLTTKKEERIVGVKNPRAFKVGAIHVDDESPESEAVRAAAVPYTDGMIDLEDLE